MPIILPHELTSAEIRVLQEYRRLNAESLPLERIKELKHPSGGGEAPAKGLSQKGFLLSGENGELQLSQKAKDFLAIDARPAIEESGGNEENEDAASA